ncbi:MAG: bifunctional transaldolase/phosoglucose isomerase [Acidobacteriales bacterium]|nr:bifunctional transaldolase/phosoglucose isomerase [Terriglobales bacterium]
MSTARAFSEVAEKSALRALAEFGQSVWLDYIRRNLITSGELRRMVEQDGLLGVTSNPSIFQKAIAGSTDYADVLDRLRSQNLSAKEIYEHIAIRDIQDAADILASVYRATQKRDGYISLEVSPDLARYTQGTIDEARRLWKAVGRPNVMIKVPGTPEGVPAIRQLISEGINVNVTLLFSQDAYVAVAKAYIEGLEALAGKTNDLSGVASVASFFVSRIDSLIDGQLTARLKTAKDPAEQELLRSVMGKVAIANAKQAYQKYEQLFKGERWQKLAERGAQTQRLLWASTSTKNPNYRDVIYIEELIGPDTVNTVPVATLDAFREHGRASRTLDAELAAADRVMANLEKAGIAMSDVTRQLLDDGIKLFKDAFDELLKAVEAKKAEPNKAKSKINRLGYTLPEPLKARVAAAIEDWRSNNKVARLWKRDPSLWTNDEEAKWMGWLEVTDRIAHLKELLDAAVDVQRAGFRDVLLLGMGGSSLCTEVLKMTFGKRPGYPELHVLDSTDPAQVKAFEEKIDPAKTLFIVSSKSGSTLEPNIFQQYFFELTKEKVGAEKAGEHFIAITDPGSKLEAIARKQSFRYIFPGVPSIGGRYSALSNFGLVPAAIMGLDVKWLLEQAEEMVHACAASVPADQNPGVVLGAILGTLGRNGRDKLTIFSSPGIWDLGAWLEQLIAESTGKQGKGIIPVDREQIGSPQVYGNDRIFVYLRLEDAADRSQDEKVSALEKAGHAVVRIDISDLSGIAEEFFRWEIATAVAGSILGINPFDQPDVEASKIATRELTTAYENSGSLPTEKPIFEEGGIKLFTDKSNAERLLAKAGNTPSLLSLLRAHLQQLSTGDYFALLAYLQMNDANEERLQAARHAVRDGKRAATCLGFGPRFLHSTGQAYKGGPNTGVFLQITADDALDLSVPGQKYTFGVVKAAQARGDFQVLAERQRRALRVHLPADVASGLRKLEVVIKEALK